MDSLVLKRLHLNPSLRLVKNYAAEHMHLQGFLYWFRWYREYKTKRLFDRLVKGKLLRKEQDKVYPKLTAYYLTFDGIKKSLRS